jgi:hypothetical protein
MNDLNNASLGEVANAWGSALPYENADPRAAATLDACEKRLRELHPDAMGIYDRLRKNEGLSRADAMRTAAPEFLKHPRPRPAAKGAVQSQPARPEARMSDAEQWQEMAEHLVQAHGGNADGLIGSGYTLEQLHFAHADTHLALASINTRPPDGHTHPLPMNPGRRTARESSYRPFPASPSIPYSAPVTGQTGLPHLGWHPGSEEDWLADLAAGRFGSPAAADAAAGNSRLIKAAAARASAAWLARTSFPSPVQTQPPPSRRTPGISRARQGATYRHRGRGR